MAKKETGVFFIFDDQRKKVKKPATFFFFEFQTKKKIIIFQVKMKKNPQLRFCLRRIKNINYNDYNLIPKLSKRKRERENIHII